MHKKGSVLIAIGLLLLAAALLLTLYNIWDAHRADVAAQSAVQALKTMIPGQAPEIQESQIVSTQTPDPREMSVNETKEESMGETREATEDGFREESEGVLQRKTAGENWKKSEDGSRMEPEAEVQEESEEETPEETVRTSRKTAASSTILADIPREREMPTMELNGYLYIGVLDVDSLELSLPVMDQWDYERLKISPCRFSGNVYEDNLVICAHNYAHHFTPLKYVPIGTEIKFTDTEGTVFHYAVSSIETVGPNDVERMVTGDWDLTLFTCNTGGQTRCAIRCVRIQ